MLHPWIRGRIWAYGVPNQYARFDAVVLRSRCYTIKGFTIVSQICMHYFQGLSNCTHRLGEGCLVKVSIIASWTLRLVLFVSELPSCGQVAMEE